MKIPVENRQRTGLGQITRSLADSGVLDVDMPATDASMALLSHGDNAVPVVQGSDVVGLLRSSDILKWMMINQK